MNDDSSNLYSMRHSLAHIMANAIQHIWPDAKFGVGPVVENGFYYDVDLGDKNIAQEDLVTIEDEMRRIITADEPFEMFEMSIDQAIEWANNQDQPYKLELLNDLSRSGTTFARDLDTQELGLSNNDGESKVESVSFYRNGDFTDLCRGPHVESTGKVGTFKLIRISGAYWRGKESNTQMQRIYGIAFNNESDIKKYLTLQEEAKKRDHRKLGQELDLFVFSDLVGPGLPLFTPRGTVLREELGRFSQELQKSYGYERVWIPHIARESLYETSGHLDKYPERFSVTSFESDDKFMMKPMNCPHHVQIYSSRPRSYRDLPIRYMENTVVYRDEKTGEMHGLSRVRAITQDDGHVFCRVDQIEQEFKSIMMMIRDMYMVFDMQFKVRLSFRDNSDKFLGEKQLWERSQELIEKVARDLRLDYFIGEGEAAFYGPKIDIMVIDSLGREWQCATEQLDFVQPERFKLEYVSEDGSKQQPVMIHKALLGSIERFLSVYIEHTAGRFPIWLAPEQVRVITVNQEEKTTQYAQDIVTKAEEMELRFKLDNNNESVGKKIRDAELMKVPYILVIGDKEINNGLLSPRIRKDLEVQLNHQSLGIEEFIKTVSNEVKSRASQSSI